MLRRPVSHLFAGLALFGLPALCPGQEPQPVEMTISAKAASPESLRYRLLPLEARRTPGDAVPIYLRLASEMRDEALNLIKQQATVLQEAAIQGYPTDHARKLLDQFSRRLQQMEFAARRQTADWNYTIPEQRQDVINILLPDVQELRSWSRLVPVKARLAMAEGRYDDAVNAIETGISMGRQIAEGPFVINALVGIAVANQSVNQLETLLSRPDAPNLYWSLTALPRPLVDIRKGLETEQTVVEDMMPEIADLDDVQTVAEWTARLVRLHKRWNPLAKALDFEVAALAPNNNNAAPPAAKPVTTVPADLEEFVEQTLPEAREFLKNRGEASDEMSDAETIVRYVGAQHRELRDLNVRSIYLPYPEAARFYDTDRAERENRKGPVAAMLSLFQPALLATLQSQAKLDRRIAAMRVVEALRMHLAEKNGKLPGSLDEVKVVPIPDDPTTGKPFEYKIEGDAASLSSPVNPPLVYRIRVAK